MCARPGRRSRIARRGSRTAPVRALLGFAVLGAMLVPGSARAAAGDSSLLDAVRRGDREAVRSLVRRPAVLTETAPDGSTALHLAVEGDDRDMVALLLEAGASPTVVNRYGVQPIALSAVSGNASVMSLLLRAGASPNASLPEGETLLMTTARTGSPEAVTLVIEAGADVNSKDSRGQTALLWAAARDNAEAVRLLVKAGAEVNARTSSTTRTTRVSESGNSFLAPQPTGFTALLFAVRAGARGAVAALLDHGANVNDTLSDGQSALVVAAANAHWQLAGELLDRGADPNLAGAG